MNQMGRWVALFFVMTGLAGVLSYPILKTPLGLYVGWGSILLGVAVTLIVLSHSLSIAVITSTISMGLATGAIVAYGGFHDLPAAWFFLIAAVFSLLVVPLAVRYLRPILGEEQEVSEPQACEQRWGDLLIKGLSLGFTLWLLGSVGYLGWHTWPKVSGNVYLLTLVLLIFLALWNSMAIKRLDKKPGRWLSIEGLLALSGFLLDKLLLPFVFVLLLLNFAMK